MYVPKIEKEKNFFFLHEANSWPCGSTQFIWGQPSRYWVNPVGPGRPLLIFAFIIIKTNLCKFSHFFAYLRILFIYLCFRSYELVSTKQMNSILCREVYSIIETQRENNSEAERLFLETDKSEKAFIADMGVYTRNRYAKNAKKKEKIMQKICRNKICISFCKECKKMQKKIQKIEKMQKTKIKK